MATYVAGNAAISDRRAAGFLWATVSMLIFSGWCVITRFRVTRELEIWDIKALRFGGGALVFAPMILRRGVRLPAAAWREGLLFCCLWGLPFVLPVALVLRLTSAAQAASIAPAAMPVFAGIVGRIALGERQGSARWLGYGATILGLICLVGGGAARHGSCPWLPRFSQSRFSARYRCQPNVPRSSSSGWASMPRNVHPLVPLF